MRIVMHVVVGDCCRCCWWCVAPARVEYCWKKGVHGSDYCWRDNRVPEEGTDDSKVETPFYWKGNQKKKTKALEQMRKRETAEKMTVVRWMDDGERQRVISARKKEDYCLEKAVWMVEQGRQWIGEESARKILLVVVETVVVVRVEVVVVERSSDPWQFE